MDCNNNTLFIGKVLKEFEQLDSTNLYAQSIINESKPIEGTVICAKSQVAGRGQMGNRWLSEAEKNITLSVILYPSFLNIEKQFWLNKCIALGIFDFVSNHFPNHTYIKWPNDIYIKNKKVGGILIQNNLKGFQIKHSIIGIGINVNQQKFPKALPNPTSFFIEEGKTFDISTLQQSLFYTLEKRYLQLRNEDLNNLHTDYLKSLYNYQQEAIFQYPKGNCFKGRIIGISEIGKLQIAHGKEIEEFGIKEIIQ